MSWFLSFKFLPVIDFRLIRMSSQTRKSSSRSSTGSVTSRWLRSCTSTSPRPWRARRTWTTSSTSVGRPRRAAPASRTWESALSGQRRSSTLSQNSRRFATQKEYQNLWLDFGCFFSLSGNKCLKTLSKDTVISSYLQHISERELFGMNRGCFQTVSDFKLFCSDFDISFSLWMDIRAEIREIIANGSKNFNFM